MAGNPDYPSGHSAHGGHVAMILAELAPQRSDALYARGREFAESRYVSLVGMQFRPETGAVSKALPA